MIWLSSRGQHNNLLFNLFLVNVPVDEDIENDEPNSKMILQPLSSSTT